jgi:hypothetical protein
MPGPRVLDDASVEAVLRGDIVAPELEPLAGFVSAIRTAAAQPVRPSRELADRMASGVFVTEQPDRRMKVGMTLSKLAAMSVRTKVAAGCAVALTGLTGVTAAGALPDAAQQRVETMIESVTPIDFPDRAEFGQEVAEDARDGGVDGQQISEQAREQARQPADAITQGQADDHNPAGVPAGPPSSLPTPDQTLPESAENRPGPDDRPGAGVTGRPDDLPADAGGGAPSPPIPG